MRLSSGQGKKGGAPTQTHPQKTKVNAASPAQSSRTPTNAAEASAVQTSVHRAVREPGGPMHRRGESASC
eukprot:11989891-Alexandrium_andersonii.AAC.1